MKYSKRIINLELRCIPCVISADITIDENIDISQLYIINSLRGVNKYSPVETFMKIYPEQKMTILNKLKLKRKR